MLQKARHPSSEVTNTQFLRTTLRSEARHLNRFLAVEGQTLHFDSMGNNRVEAELVIRFKFGCFIPEQKLPCYELD